MNTLIKFEDTGQDFLEWIVSPTGLVLDCAPLQREFWINCIVRSSLHRPSDGELVLILDGEDKKDYVLKHVVLSKTCTDMKSFDELVAA